MEIWKSIIGYEGLYEVSNIGRIKSLAKQVMRKNGRPTFYPEKILKLSYKKTGYVHIQLNHQGVGISYSVHTLVAKAFIKNPDPDNLSIVNHLDGDKSNNKVENLEWSNDSLNGLHAFKVLKVIPNNRKLTENDVDFIRASPNLSGVELAKILGVKPACISKVRIGRSWYNYHPQSHSST